jgi:asparagine synthase (glutamine-hydrolysing)
MCGITGVLRLDGAPVDADDVESLGAMAAELRHRGPDGETVVESGPAALGFTRLAVFDVCGGQQPFWSEDGSVAAIVNGTIYNHDALRSGLSPRHAFRTRSDCEVVLHLYEEHGASFVEHLLGMFAVAIWDSARQRLVLARDRLGLKPLYYAQAGGRLLFGSEIKALLRHPACPRSIAWDELLADPLLAEVSPLAHTPIHSGIAGLQHLPGGCLVEADARRGTVRERAYWRLPDPHETGGAAAADIAEEYGRLLSEAIDLCLTGDAALGLTLSGGVDSAIIAGHAASRDVDIRTFSTLSRGTTATGDSAAAFQLATALGLSNHQVRGDDPSRFTPDYWKELLWVLESPMCGPEQLYKRELFRWARHSVPNLKVMLSGQGADEFTGGYSTTLLPDPTAGWPEFIERLRLQAVRERRVEDPVRRVWDRQLGFPAIAHGSTRAAEDVYRRFLETKQRDLLMYNLWSEDRLASAHSIEARAPYLDHRLVELAASVPSRLRAELLWDKQIIRAVGARMLPATFARREKIPFFHGRAVRSVYRQVVELLHARDGVLIEEAFSSGRAREVVDVDVLRRCLSALRLDVEPYRVELVLRLVNIGLLEQLVGGVLARKENGVPLPEVLTSDAASDELQVADALAEADRVPAAAIPVLRRNVLLLTTSAIEPERFVVVDGQIRFTLDAGADAWWEAMHLMDGTRCFGDICAEIGVTMEELEAEIATAIEYGLVEVSATAAAVERRGVAWTTT